MIFDIKETCFLTRFSDKLGSLVGLQQMVSVGSHIDYRDTHQIKIKIYYQFDNQTTPQFEIRIGVKGLLFPFAFFSIFSRTCCPEATFPNTTCFPSRAELGLKVIKN